jgi:thiol-disulfide isomerase/thioredoxin
LPPVGGKPPHLSHTVHQLEAPGSQTQARSEPYPNCGKVDPNGSEKAMPAGPKVGEPAPGIKLKDLTGKDVGLEEFEGEETLVLFWSPGCGFCQRMLPELKRWEADPPEANRQMWLSSTVVLDQQLAVGRAFGASGTPSAVLVDVEGKVASEVAVGAPAVLELARAGRTAA